MIRNYLVGIVVVLGLFNLCSATERITRGFSPLGVDTYTTGESDALLAAKQDLLTSSTDVNVRNLDANSIDANDGNFNNLTVNGNAVASANDVNGTFVKLISGNSITVTPDQNLQTQYNWLKSSDRDANMGALSPTNWRTLIFSDGDYNLITSTLVLDTNYISFVHKGNPSACFIYGEPNAPLVIKQCDFMYFEGMTFKNTNTTGAKSTSCAATPWATVKDNDLVSPHTFLSIESSAADTTYWRCDFRHSNPSIYTRESFRGKTDTHGKFLFCNGDAGSLRVANNCKLLVNIYDSNFGVNSIGGDNDNNSNGAGYVASNLYRVTAGSQGWGGCTIFGMDVYGYAEDCNFSGNSGAMGKTFYATVKRSKFLTKSVGGYGMATSIGRVASTAIIEDCEITQSTGGSSLGMSATGGCAGTVIRTKLYTDVSYWKDGNTIAAISDYTGGVFKDNHSPVPTKLTANATIYPFDNGQTYTNATATGPTTATMPIMYAGAHFLFLDANDTATVDPNVKPPSGGHFILPDGTAMDVNEGLINDDDKPNWLTTDYIDSNSVMVNYGHTWTQETP